MVLSGSIQNWTTIAHLHRMLRVLAETIPGACETKEVEAHCLSCDINEGKIANCEENIKPKLSRHYHAISSCTTD